MELNLKRMYKIFLGILVLASVLSCRGQKVQLLENGIIIPVGKGETRLVRLQVMSENIIRVSASPSKEFSSRKSLMTVDKKWPEIPFQVQENKDSVILSTTKIHAVVNRKTGEVAFVDITGKVRLVEKQGGGKHFEPIRVENDRGYSFSQVFESPGDEAFYGLGQHQSDEFNYKGRNEVLYQYNTKVSVPFIVST